MNKERVSTAIAGHNRPSPIDTPMAGGRPERCCGRQALDSVLLGQFEYGARAHEANPRGQALNYAHERIELYSGLERHQNEKGGADGHEHVGAETSGLVFRLALEPDDSAENHRRDEANSAVPDCFRVGQIHEVAGPLHLSHALRCPAGVEPRRPDCWPFFFSGRDDSCRRMPLSISFWARRGP